MFTRSRGKRKSTPAQAAEGISQTLAHSAEGAAQRVSGAAEHVGGRVAREAGQVGGVIAKGAGQARGRVAQEAGQLSGQLGKQTGRGPARGRAARRHAAADALLKAQLAKTSRELAHESSELGDAVNSLNKVIKANRKAAARGRTRLLGGLAIGAALMYHFDPERGRERRAETGRRLSQMAGRSSTPAQSA